jgi:hypothetical protein
MRYFGPASIRQGRSKRAPASKQVPSRFLGRNRAQKSCPAVTAKSLILKLEATPGIEPG